MNLGIRLSGPGVGWKLGVGGRYLRGLALNGVQKYSVGGACIVLWVEDTSKASGYGLELRDLVLAFFRMHVTYMYEKYIQAYIHNLSHSACQHASQIKEDYTFS